LDPLTHTATGLFLSRAGFGRLAPQAPWVLMLAANAPDLDAVSAAAGTLSYLNYHRHLTHAVAVAPVMALATVLVARVISRKPFAWGRIYCIALAGVLSHLLLDWTNIYGIRLLLPFSGRWFHLDWTSVIDLWIWAVFLVGLAGPLLSRLVASEIGAPSRRAGMGFAIFALGFLVLYNGGRAVLHSRAVATLDARLYDGAAPGRTAALPDPLNPFAWRGLVETEEAWSVHQVNLLADFDPHSGRRFYKPAPDPALQAAGRSREFQDFLRFSEYPFWRMTEIWEPDAGTRVEAMDLRFGTPADPGFVVTAILNPQLQVIRAWFTFGNARPR